MNIYESVMFVEKYALGPGRAGATVARARSEPGAASCLLSRILIMTCLATSIIHAQDWPQWRGPDRTGSASSGPKLIESIPEQGLTELWRNESIPDRRVGLQSSDVGFSTPVAAGGRVYQYLNQKVADDSPLRISRGILDRLGCCACAVPASLAGKIEAARCSPERKALAGAAVYAWAGAWIVHQLSHAQYVQFAEWAEDRLIRGDDAIDLPALEKAAALQDKSYATSKELEQALDTTGLASARTAAIVREMTSNRKRALDVLLCYDLETGRILWKNQSPGALFEYGTSSTPCISNGRIYFIGGKSIYCCNAKDGAEIWQAPCPAKEVSSSPIVADGLLLIQAGALCALDIRDGSLRWTRPEFKGVHASPTVWRKNGQVFAVQNAGVVELQTGRLIWGKGGVSDSSPVIGGDVLIANSTTGYRLGEEKAQELWSSSFSTGWSTPLTYQGYLYGTKSQQGPLFCIDLATGKTAWTGPDKGYNGTSGYNCTSCILADGKIFIDGGNCNGTTLTMVRADPAKFTLLGKCKVVTGNYRGSTPTIVDGRLLIRGETALVCYDLRAR